MSPVIVTGSCGRIGRVVGDELTTAGIEWQGADATAPIRFTLSGRFEHRRIDLTDFGATLELLSGARGVIHLANISYPHFWSDHQTFTDNLTINYNVFAAADLLRVPKVVWLSSQAVFGVSADSPPRSLPYDDSHPLRPTSAYGLSKLLSERMAEYFAERAHTNYVAVRPTVVQERGDYAAYAAVAANPALRGWHLWSYVDARDLARACRMALEAPLTGAVAFSVAAADTMVGCETADLCRRFLPGVPHSFPPGSQANLLNAERAKELIGFVPAHSWRDNLP